MVSSLTTMTRTEVYQAWIAADAAWQEELVRRFGDYAEDARYDWRGSRTEKLYELKARYRALGERWYDWYTR